ncbi:unnamed protein product [Heterobilharzia americana]|nr:unnamed protein product [Heterobilharzia americana]CAH8587001.1 unnamed protein product [Heterobilharzia americana]
MWIYYISFTKFDISITENTHTQNSHSYSDQQIPLPATRFFGACNLDYYSMSHQCGCNVH